MSASGNLYENMRDCLQISRIRDPLLQRDMAQELDLRIGNKKVDEPTYLLLPSCVCDRDSIWLS